MRHRHLDIGPETPVQQLPAAALVDLLARGDLEDWRGIVAALAEDPDGEFAATVVRLIDAYPMYGTSRLFRAWIDRRRALGADPIGLAAFRRKLGLTQVELAGRIGMSQSDLSKLERRPDVRVSSLRDLAAALGGNLEIVFEIEGVRSRIALSRTISRRSRASRSSPASAGAGASGA